MHIHVPILLETLAGEGAGAGRVTAQPLFFSAFARTAPSAERALQGVRNDVQKHLMQLAQGTDQGALLAWADTPDYKAQRLSLRLDDGQREQLGEFMLVTYRALDRWLAFTPKLSERHFELAHLDDLPERAAAVMSHWLKTAAKANFLLTRLPGQTSLSFKFCQGKTNEELQFSQLALGERAGTRFTVLELEINTAATSGVAPEKDRASLGGVGSTMDGATELGLIGRCLNQLYPEGLERALGVEPMLAVLDRALCPPNKKRAAPKSAADSAPVPLNASHNATPLLLVGPAGVGKTALLHEWLFRRHAGTAAASGADLDATQWAGGAFAKASKTVQTPPRVWLISPQRLISGMSYLGQWEARWLAILQHAASAQRNIILYFDDLLGLFSAGPSSASTLSAGDVLLPWLANKSVRVLAEASPEVWRVLRERQRAFSDMFRVEHVLELPEATEALANDVVSENYPVALFAKANKSDYLNQPSARPPSRWQVLSALARGLEQSHALTFELSAVPCALELSQRFNRERVFPGNVADTLKKLAARAVPGACITREDVIADFSRRLGLNLAFLDRERPLSYSDIVQTLRTKLAGQDAAVAAIAGAVVRAKTLMNDPKRPLAVLLLLGPTGVGKTQSAKALAALLSGASDAANGAVTGTSSLSASSISPAQNPLLRFDLNEYTEPGDAARLIGTWHNPDGLLTAAIRRQPNAVVLLDEIEKATPEVFDVLLSLLDEGRLTDARGRVADFTRAFILMTSNLGAREARQRLGFTAELANREPHAGGDGTLGAGSPYRDAAKRFFRPEFFNRLDDVIGFQPFSRAELHGMTEQLVHSALKRSGVAARKCLISVSEAAIDFLQTLALDPALGARALKRGIERALVQPLARHLAALGGALDGASDVARGTIVAPTRITLGVEHSALSLHVSQFQIAQANDSSTLYALSALSPAAFFEHFSAQLEPLEHALQTDATAAGVIELGAISPRAQRYFAAREQLLWLQTALDTLARATAKNLRGAPGRTLQPRSRETRYHGANLGGAAFERGEASLASNMAELGGAVHASAVGADASEQDVKLHARRDAIAEFLGGLAWLDALAHSECVIERQLLRLHSAGATAPAYAASDIATLAAALRLLPGVTSASYQADQGTLALAGFALTALMRGELGWTLDVNNTALAGLAAADEPAQIIRVWRSGLLDLRSGRALAPQPSVQERLRYFMAHVASAPLSADAAQPQSAPI
jgi:ATP-dependent Clp protease ATP-binding subunit ClpC